MPTPKVGSQLWYWPPSDEQIDFYPGSPLAAIVVAVTTTPYVNLVVFDAMSEPFARRNVQLVQADEPKPLDDFAEWPDLS